MKGALCRTFCTPSVCFTEGADHTGVDAFLRCHKCRWRSESHVECARVTPAIANKLVRDWRRGRFA